jgi:CheY-like chemotaxis protein
MDMPSNMQIIYVDDDEVDRHIFEIVLNKIMITPQITFIKNGQEFLDFFYKENSYKDRDIIHGQLIIFLDINMPYLSGLDVLKKLSESPITQDHHLPIVMFSGSEREKDIYESKKLGAMDYIVKPFSYQEMIASLSTLITEYIKIGKVKEMEI